MGFLVPLLGRVLPLEEGPVFETGRPYRPLPLDELVPTVPFLSMRFMLSSLVCCDTDGYCCYGFYPSTEEGFD